MEPFLLHKSKQRAKSAFGSDIFTTVEKIAELLALKVTSKETFSFNSFYRKCKPGNIVKFENICIQNGNPKGWHRNWRNTIIMSDSKYLMTLYRSEGKGAAT